MNSEGSLSVFDFDTQAGITHLLASIRASQLSPEQKNDLRDTVFLYANGGRDQSVRIQLEQKITTYGLTPVGETSKPKAPAAPTPARPTIGSARPAPAFSAPAASSVPSSNPTQPTTTTTPPTAPAPQPQPPTQTAPPQQAPAASVAPTPEPAPAQPAPTTPPQQPSAAPAPQSVPVQATPPPVTQTQSAQSPVAQMTSVPPPPASPQPAPASSTPTPPAQPPINTPTPPTPPASPNVASQEEYLNRIREIKALVNEKVGNPVNLVDIDNEVGREYMGALLDAMKKINSGASAISAMKRLEDAFSSVEKVVREKGTEPKSPEPSQPAPKPPVEERTPIPPTLSPQPEPSPEPKKPAPPPTPPAKSETVPRPPPAPPRSVSKEEDKKPVTTTPAAAWGAETDTNKKPAGSFSDTKLSSLAESSIKPRTPEDLPSKSSLDVAGGDPLMTAEVTEGLDQLLSEWSLFKKSGLFGTGPKGREHPLFKKIAGLQIPLLLAGRFEGATQEIKQSITDYMNGWRYEQGIIYNQGETFEHYLRRVIRHILDLQKKKSSS